MQVNIGEAKARFSYLVGCALLGDEVIIARDNKPLLRLVPIEHDSTPRQPGSARGQVWISPDFDAPLAEFEDYER